MITSCCASEGQTAGTRDNAAVWLCDAGSHQTIGYSQDTGHKIIFIEIHWNIWVFVNNTQAYLDVILQLGQPSVNPPRLVLEVGGTSTLQAAMPVKLKSPPLQASKWGGLQLSRYGCLLSWSPPSSSTSLGGFTLNWPSCILLAY